MRHAVPLLAITGQVNKAVLGLDAFQEIPIVSVCRTITKHHYLVTTAADIPRVINEALAICTTGRPGPVIVDVPKDLQAQVVLADDDPPVTLLPKPTDYPKPIDSRPGACPHPVLSRLWHIVHDRGLLANTFITTGTGPTASWVAGSWRFPDPAKWIHSTSLGAVGFALPAAIGAQAGHSGATVVAVDTPAGFIASVHELACAFCEKLPVKVLLLRPDALQPEEEPATDFTMLARGFRAGSVRVATPDDLDAGLAAMLDSTGPFLLDVALAAPSPRFPGRSHEAHARPLARSS
jgi:thiamine pyrophosphate-dependent acetolactate synthase large subunit-like protein